MKAMPDKGTKTTLVTFERRPPRPVSGSGDIIVPFGDTDHEVILRWEKGEIVDVLAHGDNTAQLEMFRITMQDESGNRTTPQVVTCSKCAKDSTTGQQVYWPVQCLPV